MSTIHYSAPSSLCVLEGETIPIPDSYSNEAWIVGVHPFLLAANLLQMKEMLPTLQQFQGIPAPNIKGKVQATRAKLTLCTSIWNMQEWCWPTQKWLLSKAERDCIKQGSDPHVPICQHTWRKRKWCPNRTFFEIEFFQLPLDCQYHENRHQILFILHP
jgi:hypothetical protein